MEVAFTWGCNTSSLWQKLSLAHPTLFALKILLHCSHVCPHRQICSQLPGEELHRTAWVGNGSRSLHKMHRWPADPVGTGQALLSSVCQPGELAWWWKHMPKDVLKVGWKQEIQLRCLTLHSESCPFFYYPYLKCTILASKTLSPVSALRDSLNLLCLKGPGRAPILDLTVLCNSLFF